MRTSTTKHVDLQVVRALPGPLRLGAISETRMNARDKRAKNAFCRAIRTAASAALVISVKTASVHVSHILRKLDAPNRLEAAAIAHRIAPPPTG